MGADENIKTIQAIYEAFGRGDVDAVLDRVTDDVDRATETSSTVAPWYGVRHGKDGVADFFQALGSTNRGPGIQSVRLRRQRHRGP